MLSLITARRKIARLVWFSAAVASLTVACERVPLLAPTGSTITLTTGVTALPVDGSTEIIAQIVEAAGTPPHSGTHVTFFTTLGTVAPPDVETDVNGRVIVRFRAGDSNGTATITATSGGASTGANGGVKIAVGTAAVGRVTISANPASVPSNGGSTTIVADVFDINGNALNNAPVSFTTTAGSLANALVITNAIGRATTTLTTSQQATVTGSVGAQAPATPTHAPKYRRRHDTDDSYDTNVFRSSLRIGNGDGHRGADTGDHAADDSAQRRSASGVYVRCDDPCTEQLRCAGSNGRLGRR